MYTRSGARNKVYSITLQMMHIIIWNQNYLFLCQHLHDQGLPNRSILTGTCNYFKQRIYFFHFSLPARTQTFQFSSTYDWYTCNIFPIFVRFDFIQYILFHSVIHGFITVLSCCHIRAFRVSWTPEMRGLGQ